MHRTTLLVLVTLAAAATIPLAAFDKNGVAPRSISSFATPVATSMRQE